MLKKIQTVTLLFCLISFSVFNICKEEDVEKKIDPNLRLALKNLKTESKLDQTLAIVFKVNEPLTDIHHDLLKENQLKIIAHIGQIYTASIPAKNVIDLAKMQFVEYIRTSREFRAHPKDSSKVPNKLEEYKK